jgi:predicted TIM-barrel fold metal-dependent hydrolase
LKEGRRVVAEQFDVVDCHIHLFRNEKEGWQGRAIMDRWDRGGSLAQVLRYMDETGVAAGWIINAWPREAMRQSFERRLPASLSAKERRAAGERIRETLRERCERKNEWLCRVAQEYPGRFAPMIGGIDPYFGTEWVVEEIGRRHQQGAKGIKMIATWGGYYPSDEALMPAYERLQELGMVILSHSGGLNVVGADIKGNDFALPKQWEPILEAFPHLNVVLAHLGYQHGLSHYGTETHQQRVALAKRFPNVYFDLSGSFEKGYDNAAVRMVKEVGVERCVWASDWHAHRSVLGLQTMKRAAFDTNAKRQMLGETARTLIAI